MQLLSSRADIAIYGGSAGGGKTWALLADPLLHLLQVPGFGGVIFRRTTPQIKSEGGLWDTSMSIYSLVKASPLQHELKWKFPNGNKITFAHLEYEKDKLNWQGGQIPYIGFDELTHFSLTQFLYLISRSRSTCGVRPYIRATTNPDADSWVADFISWWIDQETGFAIPERSGVVRWFYRLNDQWNWYGSRAEAEAAHPDLASEAPPTSCTFVLARLEDNQILLKKDPGYRAKLMAQNFVERERLLGGNWKVRHTAGNVFKREWLTRFVDVLPNPQTNNLRAIRYWDEAASTTGDDSSGALLIEHEGRIIVADIISGKWTWQERNKIIEATAEMDAQRYPGCELWIEELFGAGGKVSVAVSAKLLRRFGVRFDKVNKSKIQRAQPFAAACERGEVYLNRGEWNRKAIEQLVGFPPPKDGAGVDDIVDCLTGAYNKLVMTDSRKSSSLPQGSRPNIAGTHRSGARVF